MSASAAVRDAIHRKTHERSYACLTKAREDARKELGYDSQAVRRKMVEECQKRAGILPYDEQLDLAECTILKVDSSFIAGTGWGKTLPYALPLLAPGMEKKITIIISPLNALETDQAHRFNKMGISAVALNGMTYTSQLHKEIEAGRHRIILAGPKMCIDPDSRFRPLLSQPSFAKRLTGFVVDEGHCITQWGNDFRPEYANLGTIRSFVPFRIPVQLASATLNPPALAQAQKTLHIPPESSFHLNLGNDRPNIAWEVRHMAAGKSDVEALAFLIPENVAELTRLSRTMVFFNDITVSMKARRWFLQQLPERLRHRVKCYNARLSQIGKDLTMKLFRRGHVDVLFTTEAAGMGCDIPDIEIVVQFMVPDSLSIWQQRAGRAGRRKDIKARAILLVQPTVFQEKGKQKRKEGESITYVKEVEEGLRMWIDTEQCRRDVADEYFDNPPSRRSAPTGKCCDNCSARENMSLDSDSSPHISRPVTPSNPADDDTQIITQSTPSKERGAGGKRRMIHPASTPGSPSSRLIDNTPAALRIPATRREDHLKEARDVLEKWRYDTWHRDFDTAPFGVQGLLPDSVLTALATRTAYATLQDFTDIRWLWAQEYGRTVAELLNAVDARRAAEKAEVERLRKEAAEVERASKRQAREMQDALEKAARERERQLKQQERAEKKRLEEEDRRRVREEKERRKAQEMARKEQARRVKAEEKARRDLEREHKNQEKRRKKEEREAKQRERVAPLDEDAAVLADSSVLNAVPPPQARPRPRPRPRPRHQGRVVLATEAQGSSPSTSATPIDPGAGMENCALHSARVPAATVAPSIPHPSPQAAHLPHSP